MVIIASSAEGELNGKYVTPTWYTPQKAASHLTSFNPCSVVARLPSASSLLMHRPVDA